MTNRNPGPVYSPSVRRADLLRKLPLLGTFFEDLQSANRAICFQHSGYHTVLTSQPTVHIEATSDAQTFLNASSDQEDQMQTLCQVTLRGSDPSAFPLSSLYLGLIAYSNSASFRPQPCLRLLPPSPYTNCFFYHFPLYTCDNPHCHHGNTAECV